MSVAHAHLGRVLPASCLTISEAFFVDTRGALPRATGHAFGVIGAPATP